MKSPYTILAASIAGLSCFGWTLATYSPPQGAGAVSGSFSPPSPNRFGPNIAEGPQEQVTRLVAYLSENPGDAESWHRLGWAQHELGEMQSASESWTKAATVHLAIRPAQPDSLYLYDLACYQALAGDRDGALDSWVAAVDAGWGRPGRATRDPDLDSIRDDPRFKEAFERIVPWERGRGTVSAG